jgi:uncharacterized protein YktA (UPF0223 family)
MTKYDKVSNNIREIEKALEEMATAKVLLKYKTEKIKENRKIIDAKFEVRNRFLQYHALRKSKAAPDKHLQQKNFRTPNP